MAMNLQAVLKIAAEVTGISNLTKLEGGLEKVEKAAKGAKEGFKDMVSSEVFQVAAIGAAGIATAMALSTKAAMDFEESMAGVRKVVDGLENPAAFKAMESDIFELSKRMPIAAKGIADIFEAAGSAGIPAAEIKQFAETVGQVSIAFDLTAGDAATALAKIKTSLGLTQPDLVSLADAMNHLSNNTASTASDLVEFVLRSGSAGKIAGLSAEQTAAFGAAMISAGVDTEVAATSFNNMVKALGKGESMTERQISALGKLGFASEAAGEYEAKHTEAVEEESRQRLAVAELETNQLKKEIDRRYRDTLTVTQDAFDDENDAYRKSVIDRQDAQIKGLETQKKNEIDGAKQRAEANNTSEDFEIARINKFYDERVDAVKDATDRELKEKQRFDRDNLQRVRDSLDDQKEIEINGTTQRFEEIKRLEATRLKEAKEQAKAAAEELAKDVATTLAKNLQTDAIGTITDVFARIRALPREQQLSVVSDLFGDEAKGLMPLIQNTELLSKALAMVGDKSKYAGSTQDEYFKRLQTATQQAKLAENNVNILAITFGQSLAPALTKLIQALTPVIEGFTWLLKNVPGLGPVLGIVGGAFAGIVAVAPGIASLVYSFKALGITLGGLKIGATIAGFAPALLPVIAGLKTLGGIIAGVFTGPVGWAVLITAAGVAIYAFRDQIGAAFKAIGEALKPAATLIYDVFIKPFMDSLASLLTYVNENFLKPMNEAFIALGGLLIESFNSLFVIPFKEAFTAITTFISENFTIPTQTALTEFAAAAYESFNATFIEPTKALFTTVTTFINENFIIPVKDAISQFATAAYESFNATFIEPLKELFSTVTTYIADNFIKPVQDAINKFATAAYEYINTTFIEPTKVVFQAVTDFISNNFVKPVQDTISSMIENIGNAFQSLKEAIVAPFQAAMDIVKGIVNNILNGIVRAISFMIAPINAIIAHANKLGKITRQPQIPYLRAPQFPKFAQGGVVDAPTLAMVGEGGQREYIIPESKMAKASANYMAGARGGAVIPAFANGGVVGPSMITQGSSRSSSPTIQIQTGPVLQQNNQQYVTIADMEKALTMLTDSLLLNNRTFGGRSYQGVGA